MTSQPPPAPLPAKGLEAKVEDDELASLDSSLPEVVSAGKRESMAGGIPSPERDGPKVELKSINPPL